jgi:hypothetical protein
MQGKGVIVLLLLQNPVYNHHPATPLILVNITS